MGIKSCIVYGLASSEDGRIRYVGQTTRALLKRLRNHLKDAKRRRCRLAHWIRSVVASGHDVLIFPIETGAVLHETERRLIAWYRRHGANLVNATDGGEGNHGYRWTPEQIAKISEIRTGRIITPEWRLNISMGSRGKPKPADFGQKLSIARKGMKLTPEHRANVGRASKGRKWSQEARERHSALLRVRLKGKKKSPRTPEHQAKLNAAHTGQKRSPETRAKMSAAMRARYARLREEAQVAQHDLVG